MLSLMISLFSEVDMAAHQIAIQIIHFSFLPAFAVAEACSVLSGQAVGAGAYRLVTRVARLGLVVTGIYTGAWSIALAFGSRALVSGFTLDADVVATAVSLLHIAAVFQIFDGANMVGRCALRGAGDVRYAAWVGVLTSWATTPTLAWLLGHHYRLGAFGGWLGLCLEIIVGAAILWWRLERRGWLAAAELSHRREIEPFDTTGAISAPVPLEENGVRMTG
jgi:MATE family multidrug resistance protein